MKEKRILRKHQIVFGVRYDPKTMEIMIGGPKRFFRQISEVWERVEGFDLIVSESKNRIRWSGKAKSFSWHKLRDYNQQEVRSFRRLMT